MTRAEPRRRKRLIATLATAAVLALGAAAPATAADNTGPVDPSETRASEDQCHMYMLWVWSDILHGDWTGAKYYWDLAARRGCKWAQENRTRLGNTGSRATTAPEPASVGPGTPTAPKAPRGPVAGSGLAR